MTELSISHVVLCHDPGINLDSESSKPGVPNGHVRVNYGIANWRAKILHKRGMTVTQLEWVNTYAGCNT